MRLPGLTCAFAVVALAAVGAAEKFHGLAIGSYPPGSRVPITNAELNSYLASEVPLLIGPGVRNVRVETESGDIVRGFADIDFLKVRQSYGDNPNRLVSELLAGERPVAITVKVASTAGKCRVDLLSVSVSGLVIEGGTLDFLIRNFVLPNFPDVKIGKDFELDFNIDRLEIRPGIAYVVLRGR
jgi:hypothetical protein